MEECPFRLYLFDLKDREGCYHKGIARCRLMHPNPDKCVGEDICPIFKGGN